MPRRPTRTARTRRQCRSLLVSTQGSGDAAAVICGRSMRHERCAETQKGTGIAASPRVAGLQSQARTGMQPGFGGMLHPRRQGHAGFASVTGTVWPPLPKELPPPVHGGPLRDCRGQQRSLVGYRFQSIPGFRKRLRAWFNLRPRHRFHETSARSFGSAFAVLPLGTSGLACAIPLAGLPGPPLARHLPQPDPHRDIPVPVSCDHPKASSLFRTV